MNQFTLLTAIMMISLTQQSGCSEASSDSNAQNPESPPELTVGDQFPTRPDASTDARITEETEIEEVSAPQSESGQDSMAPDVDDLPEIDADAPSLTTAPEENNIPATEARPGLAVVPFKLQGRAAQRLDASDGASIATILMSEIASDRYRLFERQQLEAILREKDFAGRSDLATDSDAIRAGRIAGIRYLVVGEVIQLGSEFTLAARLVDCLNGEIGERGSVNFATMDQIRGKLPELIYKLGLSGEGLDVSRPERSPELSRPAPTGNELMDATQPTPPFAVRLGTADGRDGYTIGDRISFVVDADKDCFITMLAMDSEGRVTQLLPNRINPGDVFLQRGQTISFPPPGASYQFAIKDPPWGVTRVKVLATTQPLRIPVIAEAKGALPALGQVDGELMRAAAEQWKSISVLPVPGAPGDPAQPLDADNQNRLDSWTHADLQVLTAPTRAELDRLRRDLGWLPKEDVTALPQPAPAPTPALPPRVDRPAPTPPQPVVDRGYQGDANDAVLKRWLEVRERFSDGATKSALVAQTLRERPESTTVDRIFVVYRDGKAPETKDLDPLNTSLKAVNPSFRTVPVAPMLGRKSIVPADIENQIRELMENPDVLLAIPDYPLFASSLPPDILSVQWEKQNEFRPGADVDWPRELARSIDPALIGVIDQGLDLGDQRLKALAWRNQGEVADNGIDDDGNGIIDDIHGFNPFLGNGDVAWSESGGVRTPVNHGSFCSSIIGARSTGHSLDIEGIAPNAKILSAVALDHNGRGGVSQLVAAIEYASNNGARVMNLSLGGLFDGGLNTDGSRRPTPDNFATLRDRLSTIWSRWDDVLFVSAAGNDYNNNDVNPVFPASLGFKNIITVAAIDPDGRVARALSSDSSPDRLLWEPYSNHGARTVDLAAPGSLILGIPGVDGLGINYGTSFAAPMVSAAAALVWGQNPSLTPLEVKEIILSNTTPLPSLEGQVRTSGVLNIRRALEATPED